jgi:hypothetical protein
MGDMVPGLVVGQGIYRDCIARGISEELHGPMESFVKRTIGDSARVMEAVFDEERTADELIDAIADLAAGLNPILRDARRVMESQKDK